MAGQLSLAELRASDPDVGLLIHRRLAREEALTTPDRAYATPGWGA